MVVPKLNICVPKVLIPVAGDVPVVAPINSQVNLVIKQLSATVGLGVATLAVQNPTSTFCVIFAGQVTVGLIIEKFA